MKREFRVGPGAASLILIVVVLGMTVLGVLALASSLADLRLSRRSAELTSGYYVALSEGETRLAALYDALDEARRDARSDEEYLLSVASALPEGCALSDRLITFSVDAKARRSLVYEAELLAWESPTRLRLRARILRDDAEWTDTTFEENVW